MMASRQAVKLGTMKNINSENNNENELVLCTGNPGGFFKIRVKGHLDDSWSDWLEGLELKKMANGEMILTGYIADQSALMGVLSKLYRLNLTLLSINEINRNKK